MDSAATKTKLSSSEVAFPRGGASVLTPLEIKTISNQATEDALFEQASENKRTKSDSDQPSKKRKKTKKTTKKTESNPEEEKHMAISHFNFKNLVPGSSVLGQIVKVSKASLSLAIGDNLVGQVPITAISDELTEALESFDAGSDSDSDDDNEEHEEGESETATATSLMRPKFPKLSELFADGEWLRAVVVPGQDKKKSIRLSIEPALVNASMEEDDLVPGNTLQASVKSVEDHGVVLNLGHSSFSGFMPKKELKKADIPMESLKPGHVLLASVADRSSRIVTLRPVHSETVNKKTTVVAITSIDAVHPGAVVNAVISDISENGVGARVFGMVDASFSLPHTGEFTEEKLKNHFAIGSTVRARVIGVLLDDGAKKLVLSKSPKIFSLLPSVNSESLSAFPVGFVFEEPIEVIGSDDQYIYVTASSGVNGQVHKSNADPNKVATIDYPVGSKHIARVLGFNELDNLLVMTFNPKAINAKFASVADIPEGEYISSAEISRILPDSKGLVVKIFGDFEALVPSSHMSDIRLVYPERKFKVGGKVKGRVLSKRGRKLYVTLRKSLVNMEEESIINSTENLSIGLKSTAIVEKFVSGGAIVSFFGSMKAFLPKNEISETFVENAQDYLKQGQAVSVRIMKFSPENRRVTVTLRQASELNSVQAQHLENIVVGRTVVNAVVVEKTKDAIIIELKNSSLRGLIYTGHLSDGNFEENRVIHKGMNIGESIEVVVIEKNVKSRAVVVSAKKSLINAAKTETLPLHYEDIHVGSTISGYVKSATSMGVFVRFAGRLTGLALPKNASADPNEDLSNKFFKNQSIVCQVIKVDDENKRFLLSLTESSKTSSKKTSALKNPVDQTKKLFSDFACGELTTGVIESVENSCLNVRLADNCFGRIHASQCNEEWKKIKDKKHPLADFCVGQNVKAKVIGYFNPKNHRFSTVPAFTNESLIELSLLEKQINNKKPYLVTALEDVKVGSEQVAFIDVFDRGHALTTIAPGLVGEVSVYNLSKNVDDYENFDENFPVGRALKLKVIEVDYKRHRVVLSAKHQIEQVKDLKTGQRYPAKVFFVNESNVLVELGKGVVARSFITDALNDYDQKLSDVYKTNQPVIATVMEIDEIEDKAIVSLRNERLAKDKTIKSIDDLERGMLVKGFIKAIGDAGLYVSLNKNLFALVRVSDISDAYLSDWKKYFKPYQCVQGKISQCKAEGRISMTMKESEVNGDLASYKSFEDLEVGQNYEGNVKRVTDFGVFVKLDGTTNISGLCHRSEISDNSIENIGDFFNEGDRVKVKILKIDKDKKQLSLGMKASYFTGTSSSSEDDANEDAEMEDAVSESSDEALDEDEVMQEASEGSEDESESEVISEQNEPSSATGLSTNGFDWTASILDQAANSESEDSDEEDDTSRPKKRRGRGKREVLDRTAEINSRAPESVADFERLIIGNPDSSVLWMNYMSFQLQLGEIEKSREIAERALKTINYREEQEKMNIWIAILNLENSFGTEESLAEAFQRSVQYMDSLTMHQKLIGIYQLSQNFTKAEELYKVMCKKFSQNVSVWVQCGSYYLEREMPEEAHAILARSLQSLPKKDHIDVIRKFAQLEFSKGDPEQGRSLFEGLISDAPKRTDIWNVYIDQETKTGDREKVIGLFERVITKKLSRKQAKFFFSKWLAYEEENGDEQSVAHVKALAIDYVKREEKSDQIED